MTPEQYDRWKDFARICELAPLFVVGRAGYDANAEDAHSLALPAVSSTRVRELLRAGDPATGLVPLEVLEYARAHSLYRGPVLAT